ncbi:tautomerase family protein [Caballeronia sp. 15715]|jgi:4-oxalocrotonate tautomerase|uniref:tautomerase family protein n=1 Tax=unclassified Caballeronia TaxID=2646786 RepID=UPI0039E2FFED
MPIIRVEMFEGRNADQKSSLVKELTDGFMRTCGGKIESVQVVITEYSPGDWGVAGRLASDRLKG